MARLKPHIIVPAEIKIREFDAKLLFSCVAAERGYWVITGCHNQISRQIYRFPKSILVAKSLTRKSLKIKRIARQLGHRVVAWDEEGLVYIRREFYQRYKLNEDSMGYCAALFAWGQDNRECWEEWPGYHDQPIHVTGNPRADLMRPEVRAYYGEAVSKLQGQYGPYLMVSSNFGRVNHFIPEMTRGLTEQARQGITEVPEEIRGTKQDPILAASRLRMMGHFEKLLPALGEAFPDRTIILRPHPSENESRWTECAKGLKNIVVKNEGPVLPWIMGAAALIHNCCTTGLEAHLLGRPSISFRPFLDPDYEAEFPNNLGHQAETQEAVIAFAQRAFENELKPLEADQIISERLESDPNRLASDKIMDVLEDRYLALPKAALAERMRGHIEARRRRISKFINSFDASHHNARAYAEHRFPETSLAEVQAQVATLQKTLDRFHGLQVRKLSRNIFSIERK